MEKEEFNLIEECAYKYFIEDLNENEVEIHIRISKKFRSLWLSKLSDLSTTMEEIEEYKNE